MGNVWPKHTATAYAVIVHSTRAQHARSLDCPEQLDEGLAQAASRGNCVSAKGHKQSESVVGTDTGKQSSADTEVRQVGGTRDDSL